MYSCDDLEVAFVFSLQYELFEIRVFQSSFLYIDYYVQSIFFVYL